MRACIDCLPCLARNAVELARKSAQGDAALEAEIARSGMEILESAAADGYPLPPPCYARKLMDNALAKCGGAVPDPWKKEKVSSTELALKLMERLDEIPGWNAESFESRLRLAVAGNILDFCIYADLDIGNAMETMATAFTKPVDTAAVAGLKRRMDEAKSILWIFDNCGEAVFDRLLMEPYREKITLAVRGKPAFNDLTRAELAESGYPEGYAAGGVVSNDDLRFFVRQLRNRLRRQVKTPLAAVVCRRYLDKPGTICHDNGTEQCKHLFPADIMPSSR